MRSNIFRETRIGFYVLTAILAFSIVFYFIVSMFVSMGYKHCDDSKESNANAFSIRKTIVIDPGHGGEDPGASVNEIIEKDLNLDVSIKLNNFLIGAGYTTKMTRIDDRLLYNRGEENRKKYYDLRNREAIANTHEDSIFISIHMNKFALSYCKGLQTFYSENNPESKIIASYLQENIKFLQPNNKRVIKSGNKTIYLLEKLKTPAVLVECGFISNPQEANLLIDEDYQKILALSIHCGIAEYLEN